jgi:hypothetical protein
MFKPVKIVEQYRIYQKINYCGVNFLLKQKCKYLTVDARGQLMAHVYKPVLDLEKCIWRSRKWRLLAVLEFEGDWTESLMEIENV